ncbi:MAG TPA: NAD(P)H-dependent oxidoreductase subunit E, partial [Niabella sp.]|nr:NAD(P)H-dependent oxidoreductase subunit E [Niabella sp.]
MNRVDFKNIIHAEELKAKNAPTKHKIFVCCGAGCISSGADNVMKKLQEEIKNRGLEDIEVVPTGCMGPCNQGPLVKFNPGNTVYQKIDCVNIGEVVKSQIVDKKPLEDLLLFSEHREKPFVNAEEDPYFKKQLKIALKDCGDVHPEKIEDYLLQDGYKALDKALFDMSPEDVISEIKQSRLRGRGGAGYPTGLKWETVYRHVNDQKYI